MRRLLEQDSPGEKLTVSRHLCKFTNGDKAYYLEWSTVADAPTTFGMSLGEFRRYYRMQYGRAAMGEFDRRMERVEAKGTSSMIHDSLDELLEGNRAGKGESHLSREEIVDWYCRKGEIP